MKTQVKRNGAATQRTAATKGRNFRTFLLVSQLEGRAIGERIAQARREAGLTQEQMAELATFSKRSLQDYEAGVTIPYAHMHEISALLKKPVPWFLHGEPDEGELERLREEVVGTRGEIAGLRQAVTEIRDQLLGRAQRPPNEEGR